MVAGLRAPRLLLLRTDPLRALLGGKSWRAQIRSGKKRASQPPRSRRPRSRGVAAFSGYRICDDHRFWPRKTGVFHCQLLLFPEYKYELLIFIFH